ncbi:MAG: (d)CMP kinase [Nanoarchaeota archaeon]
MRITISGKAGSGKSTIAKLLSERLSLRHYSIGDLMRSMAVERGQSLLELNNLAEKDTSIDFKLDNTLKNLGNSKDNFVVDGRLSAFFIPHAGFRIFLVADERIRAQRILKDKRQHEKSDNLEETIKNMGKREASEKKRYKKYYNVDYTNKELYDFVIDTSKLSVNEVVERIVGFIQRKKS